MKIRARITREFGLLLVLSWGCGCGAISKDVARPQVHVLLNDGQTLVGELSTLAFTLETELGTLNFDSAQAGELGPLEGRDMKQSSHLVKLWLRNGSEFVGGWQQPTVQVAMQVGGQSVSVDVPIDKLQRLRFKGQAIYPDRPLYRVLSSSGDDFFVDADSSRIHFAGELGKFSPFLSEIAVLERKDPDENLWSVRLKNGSTFHAGIQESGLELRPAMGPEKVRLSWNLLARLEPAHMPAPANLAVDPQLPAYYDNMQQRSLKESAARKWSSR